MSELPPLDHELAAKIAAGTGRVERIEHEDRVIWVKRPEVLRGKLRLYKGDPARAFMAEQKALIYLSNKGLPVAELIASGDGFFAITDAGHPLRRLLRSGDLPPGEGRQMIVAGAKALAALHAAGISHGRPNLKDMCWQDGQVRLIDFERTDRVKPGAQGHADDVIFFVFSIFSNLGADTDLVEVAHDAYCKAADPVIWTLAAKKMTSRRWFYWLSRLGAPFLSAGSDFRAIKPTFAYFAAQL